MAPRHDAVIPGHNRIHLIMDDLEVEITRLRTAERGLRRGDPDDRPLQRNPPRLLTRSMPLSSCTKPVQSTGVCRMPLV